MKITTALIDKWTEMLRNLSVPLNLASAVEEMVAVLNNPQYQLLYWESRIEPVRNDPRHWPDRWNPHNNKWQRSDPRWFLAYGKNRQPFFGFAFKWKDDRFSLYGDILNRSTRHLVRGEHVAVAAELDQLRIRSFIDSGSVAEPPLRTLFRDDRLAWMEALNAMKPNGSDLRIFNIFRGVISSRLTHIVPWVTPPTWDSSSGKWSGSLLDSPVPFLVLGKSGAFGLCYHWDNVLTVYGGAQHLPTHIDSEVDANDVIRIAKLDLSHVENHLGHEPTLTPQFLSAINARSVS